MHHYSAACVQAARDEIAAQIQSYRDLVGAASKASGMSLTRIDAVGTVPEVSARAMHALGLS